MTHSRYKTTHISLGVMAFFIYRVGTELNTITHLTPKGYLYGGKGRQMPFSFFSIMFELL